MTVQSGNAVAACGATDLVWDGSSSTVWALAANWTPANFPNASTENAIIASGARIPAADSSQTVGCFEIQGGSLNAATNLVTLTVTGDYFRNLTAGSLTVNANRTFKIAMAGTAAQTFENVDPVNYLIISNNTSVTLTESFTLRKQLDLSAMTGGTVNINGTVVLDTTSALDLVIPSGVTLNIANGGVLRFLAPARKITVNGTLKINGGAALLMANGTTLEVAAGGLLRVEGSAGNIARIESDSSGTTFNFNVLGTVIGNYFKITRPAAAGMNVTGTIQSLDNGEFHYLAANGYAVTLGAGATIPATMSTLAFFNDSAQANVRSFNASAYTGVTGTTISNWSGDVGGEANDNDSATCGSEPPGCIDWGSQASIHLTLNNVTAAGFPPSTIAAGTADTLFVTYAFGLNQSSTATDITGVTITMNGTVNGSDITSLKLYADAAGSKNCAYDIGTDTLVGTVTTLTGSPPEASFTIPGGTVTTSGITPDCIHVVASLGSLAQANKTVEFQIASTADVSNSQGYSFSETSGPPVSSDYSRVTSATTTRDWQGDSSTAWNTGTNWTGNAAPTSATHCDIGAGVRVPSVNVATASCLNLRLMSGGSLSFGATTNVLEVYGHLEGQTGYTFTAPYGILSMRGSTTQSLELQTTFPGNLVINQTIASTVRLEANSAVTGSLTVTSGTLQILDGVTLTIGGGVTVNGGTLEIMPGGTLAMGDGTTLTVSSGTLKIVGNSTSTAKVTSTGSYQVVLSGGTVQAQYYTFEHLGLNGVTVQAGATIDGTYHFQNGTFTYPVGDNGAFLKLYQKIPGDSLTNLSFDLGGSSAAGTKSIYTDPSVAAGTLTVDSYSGSISGPGTENASTYLVTWTGAVNTLDLIRQAGDAGPTSVNAGSSYFMGRFRLKQTQAGGYADTTVSSIKLTLYGTGTSSDVSAVRLYQDDTCAATSGGTLLGTGTFSGSPGTYTFSGLSLTLTANPSNTTRCVYVEYDLAAGATNGATIGGQIVANADVVNSAGYAFNASAAPTVTLGTAATILGSSNTTWTGNTSTDWTVSTNWSAGVPTSSKNCQIGTAARYPTIPSGTTASCKSLTISGSGTLTLADATVNLDIYGNFANAATFVQNGGKVRFSDGGSPIQQSISSSSTFTSLDFSQKTGGATGSVRTAGSFTVTGLVTMGTSFEFWIQNGHTLSLTNGLTLNAGTLLIRDGGTLAVGSGTTVTVSGGTFKISGINDSYCATGYSGCTWDGQVLTNKGKVTTIGGAGTWSFVATSGTVELYGFLLDRLDVNGLRIQGTASLSALAGGQFTNLARDWATPVKAVQLNTSANVTLTALNVGFMWQNANSSYLGGTSPAPTDNYYLVYAPNCGGGTITFDQWFGDFFVALAAPTPSSKVFTGTCSVSIAASASPVSLVSLSASGYDGAVSVDWETGSELDHAGFNLYRSLTPVGGYVQVNSRLIRNFSSSASFHGLYRYVDQDVVNGLTYYYYIEDVANNGARMLHGPVTANPSAANGALPSTGSGTNAGNSSPGAGAGNDPVQGSIGTPGVVDLGNGVHLLAQTRNSLRLEIVPPAATFAASQWNASYETVSVPGYSTLLQAGQPELLERDVLVEVGDEHTLASLLSSEVSENPPSTHLIAPVPAWSLGAGGALEPSWMPDAGAYALNAFTPSAFFELLPAVERVGGKSFIRIKVRPILWNAATQETRSIERIILDVSLDGNGWIHPPSSGQVSLAPAAVEGTLRIKFSRTGMYELSFADLVEAGVSGPFSGAPAGELRMYFRGSEIPIDVFSGSGFFSAGDRIRFFVSYEKEIDDRWSEVVLSRYRLGESGATALRFGHLNGSPSGLPLTDEVGSTAKARVEQDLSPVFDAPLGSRVDHFFWARIYAVGGEEPAQATASLEMPVDLPALLRESSSPVRLKLKVRGRGGFAVNPTHHVAIYVNENPFIVGEATFNRQLEPVTLDFLVPATFFSSGANKIRAVVLGDLVQTGDWDIVDIDSLEVQYVAGRVAASGLAEVFNRRLDHAVDISGFAASGAIYAYDVTDPSAPAVWDSVSISSPDGGLSRSVLIGARTAEESAQGTRLLVVEEGKFLKPDALLLARGYSFSLKSSMMAADLIVVGSAELLDAAADLIEARQAQGLRVVAARLDQVYAEFSHGVRSVQAIRDLVSQARANWTAPAPKYLLLLGDGTYDPNGYLGYARSRSTMPIPLEQGQYLDFGNDNWFVTSEASHVPVMAVGRIPTDDPETLRGYVRKILDYESGARAPSGSTSSALTFVSGSDTMGEEFARHHSGLMSSAVAARSAFSTQHIDRTALGTDAAAKTEILSAFNRGVLAMSYLGHGAEDRWAGESFFTNADAQNLANPKLPIVVALNCLNTYFYDADPSFESLGEKMVLNPSGGAIAFWGSTTMTLPNAQISLARSFLDRLGHETGKVAHEVRLGDLLLQAKTSLGESAATADSIRSYTLLGDPSMKLPEAAFAAAPPSAPQATPAKEENSGGGGFLGCGTVSTGRGGGSSGPGTGAMVEMGMLALALLLGRQLGRGKVLYRSQR